MQHLSDSEKVKWWQQIFNDLSDDIAFATKDYCILDHMRPIELPQSGRRALIRAIFAFVEGTSYSARQMILSIHKESLSPLAAMAIDEEQVEITNAGVILSKKIKTSNMNLLRLTVNQFKINYKLAADLECAGPGFEALVASVKVRDRLTHPRSPHDLSISDPEIVAAAKGLDWYRLVFEKILDAHVGEIQQRYEKMQEEQQELLQKKQTLEDEQAQLLVTLRGNSSSQ